MRNRVSFLTVQCTLCTACDSMKYIVHTTSAICTCRHSVNILLEVNSTVRHQQFLSQKNSRHHSCILAFTIYRNCTLVQFSHVLQCTPCTKPVKNCTLTTKLYNVVHHPLYLHSSVHHYQKQIVNSCVYHEYCTATVWLKKCSSLYY